MAFQAIVEFVAHGLEGMGIGVVAVGGVVAMVGLLRRLVAGAPSKRRPACSGNGLVSR
jgi:hypothetical protein